MPCSRWIRPSRPATSARTRPIRLSASPTCGRATKVSEGASAASCGSHPLTCHGRCSPRRGRAGRRRVRAQPATTCCAMKARPVAQSPWISGPIIWGALFYQRDLVCAADDGPAANRLCSFGRITADNAGASARTRVRTPAPSSRDRCAGAAPHPAGTSRAILASRPGFSPTASTPFIPLGTTVADHATFEVTSPRTSSVTRPSAEQRCRSNPCHAGRRWCPAVARECAIVARLPRWDSRPEVLLVPGSA